MTQINDSFCFLKKHCSFPSYKSNFIYVGNWGDKVNFADMPTSVQEPELASFFGAELIPDAVSDYVEVCASPGEVANDPSLGHQYRLQKADETGEKGNDSLDQDGFGWNGKNRVWNTISTFAPDQLRQRVAWVLSSLIVVTSVDINREHSVEDWSSYHDIFVRNAFGNYFDVLKQVSFHKLMATMLTYHESKSMSHNFEEDGVMIFPDENYAREIMQLFTIGLYKLNQDGTVVIDQNTGEPAETYDNDDIMNFSRAWTNFKNQEQRPNLEVYADFFSFENTIDPMMFPTTDGRDVFPKTGLNDGGRVYIGDKNKRCDAMPPKAWLRKGAKFIFRGSDPNVELGRKDPKYWVDPVWSDPQHYSRVILDETSNLHSELCNADPVTGACRFASTVILANDVDCIGTCNAGEYKQHISGLQPCECSIDEIRTVRVDNPATATGNLPSVWYEYVRDTCVQMAFPEPGYMKAVSEIGTTYPTVANDAMCADTRLATAGTACCDPNNNNSPKNICLFRGERTTYDTAKLRCESNGLVTCPWSTIPINYHCGTDIQWDGDHYKAGMRFSWTNEDCSMKVQIDEKGYVAMVHDVGSLTQQVKGRVRIDVGTYFRVFWDGDSFPTTSNGCEGSSSCEVRGTTCFCSTTVHTSPVFDGSAIITKEQLLTKLHIGAPNPALFDEGFYFRCTAPACISPDFSVYFTQVVDKNNDISQAIDEKTIFEVTDPLTGKTMFLSNTNSMVSVGSGFSFRNPPMFNSPVDQTQRDALAETDAVLHHYVQHSNTAPFIATRLIQHLVTSNPSPRYVGDVAEAFRTGTYSDGVNTFGTGTYGDLEATVAAVFLDDEARSTTLDADVTHGRAREPLLKLIHFFRAMELDTEDRRSREVDLIYLKDKIGQESHYAPSVFSFFLAEYQPIGPVLDMNLVAPEAQLFDAPKLIGFLNGMANLPFYGIADCEDGKGFGPFFFSRFKITDHPDERWYQCHEAGSLNPDTHVPHRFRWLPESNASPAEIVSEMDLLLTGGRLSSMNKGIITQAYAVAAEAYGDATALQHAISHFAAAPEFHVTNDLFSNETQLHERTSTVPDIPENPPPVTDYKAIVYIYLQGALDSYSLLMPNVCANGLNTQYHQVRGDIAIANHRHLVINSIGDQPCSKFGVHPEMGYIQQLYNMGEASFVANIGPLFEPIADNIEFKQGTKQVPPSLFAHNVQTAETQGVSTGDATAGGILGRIGDAINMQAGEEVFDAYSVFGTPLALEGAPGVSRPADVLTEVGVSSFTPTPSMFEHNIVEMNKHVADSIYGETFSEAISSAILRKNLLEQSIGDSLLDATTEACFTRLETPISNQFKQVTRIIAQRNNLQSKRDVFYVQLGSFDSHSDNYFGTAEKLSMLNGAIQCFANNMKGNGLWNDVTVMSASEFGRTLTSNGAGTDHAWGKFSVFLFPPSLLLAHLSKVLIQPFTILMQSCSFSTGGNHFIAGGSIAGGKIHGKYPDDLSENGPLNIGRGRLIPTTSWEGLWKGVAEWFGVESQNMAFVLPNLSNFQTNVFGKTDLYK
uniref:DUF1501 domain-containing protein n=1 Tax=Ditylum brightwellii TaxID=49249 RepID=A0A7S4S6P4_9STRA